MITKPGESANPAGPPLGERLGDPRDFVRLGALGEALGTGSAPAELIDAVTRCLDDANETARRLAVEVLILFGTAGVPALTGALGAHQPLAVRVGAASALGRIGPAAAPAIGDLCRCLEAENDMLRWHASFALGKIGAAAVPALSQVLQSPDRKAVAAAVDSLEWIGPDARPAAGDVERVGASSVDPALTIACATALAKISGDLSNGLPLLEGFSRSEDAGVRKACAERLGTLGRLGSDGLPLIIRCAGDPAPEVRAAAALAVARIEEDGSKAVPVLLGLLSDADACVRANAAMGLARYGPGASSALPQLRELQKEPDERTAAVARGAAERIEGRG